MNPYVTTAQERREEKMRIREERSRWFDAEEAKQRRREEAKRPLRLFW